MPRCGILIRGQQLRSFQLNHINGDNQMPALPVELARRVVSLVDRRCVYSLLYVSSQFRLIAEEFLYADVSFTQLAKRYLLSHGGRFLRTISVDAVRCSQYVKKLALPAVVFEFEFEEQYYDSTFRRILQCIPRLQHLSVHGSGVSDYMNVSELAALPVTPFSLTSLSWSSTPNPTLDARFIDAQSSLERLHIPYIYTPLTSIRPGNLPKLRVLEAPLETASNILPGRQVTHFKIAASSAYIVQNTDIIPDEAIRHVVVCAVENIRLHALLSLALRMPILECLEVDTLYIPIGDTLWRGVALKETKLRHIRFSRAAYYNREDIATAFNELPNLSCISVSTNSSTFPDRKFEFEFFFRGAPEPVRLPPLDIESAGQWWQDWEDGFAAVQTPGRV
ncbi:hypothetical protein EYR38_008288 [Pleurotus pulmonarius]|nr:hypothetical protein EYR38_008288 [Pleurotus pulmonarius]